MKNVHRTSTKQRGGIKLNISQSKQEIWAIAHKTRESL